MKRSQSTSEVCTGSHDETTTAGRPSEAPELGPAEERWAHDAAADLRELDLVKQFLSAPREPAAAEQSAAWEDFFHACDPLVLCIIRGCDAHWDRRDDLHQDVWAAVIRRLPKLRLDPTLGMLHGWVAGIARRLALRHTRQCSRHRDEELTQELVAMLVDQDADHAAEADRTLREEQVRELVARLAANLPDLSRRVVLMRWIDGRSVPDIARELDVTENSAWATLRRFRLRLADGARHRGLERQ